MNEDIKEILNRLERIDHKEYSGGFEFADSGSFDEDCRCFEERKKLANYITNLQKENESLKIKLDCKERLTKILPEDTEFIILTKSDYERQESEIELMAFDYKQRNEKAVKYLLNNKLYMFKYDDEELFEITTDKKAKDDLLNILKGVD